MASLKRLSISYILLFAAFTCVCVVASFYPVWVSSFTHILFPIVAMIIFGMKTRFGYIKLNSLIFGRALIILAAMGWGEFHIHALYLILFQINILEATILDFLKKHYFNAASGFLLLASSFYLVLEWAGNAVVIVNETYILWIVAYTIWNANFVALQLSGAYYLHHFLLLISPIVACIVLSDFSFWLIFRETSLILGIAILTCFKARLSWMELHPPFSNWFRNINSFLFNKKTQLSLLLIVVACVAVQLSFESLIL